MYEYDFTAETNPLICLVLLLISLSKRSTRVVALSQLKISSSKGFFCSIVLLSFIVLFVNDWDEATLSAISFSLSIILSSWSACAIESFVSRLLVVEEFSSREEEYLLVRFKSSIKVSFLNSEIYDHC